MNIPLQSLVRVIWHDAWGDATEPVNVEEAHLKHKPMKMTTLGWLLVDNEVGVSLANEHYVDDSGVDVYRGRTFILRSMIISVDAMKLSKMPAKRAKKEPAPVPSPSETQP